MRTEKRVFLVIVMVAAGLAVLQVLRTRRAAMAPELVRRVPPPGLTVGRLYGRRTPFPVPLYGPGTVYGCFSEPTDAGGTTVLVQEGTYASPEQVAHFYRDRLLPAEPKHYEDEQWAGGRRIHMLYEAGSGRLSVFIMTDSAGIRRDVRVWRTGVTETEQRGGDPRETMVLVTAIWPRAPAGPPAPK